MSQVDTVLKALDRAYCGLTFAEITNKVNDTKEAVRKTMFYLHKEGRVVRAQDRDGIVHYNITKQGQEWLEKKGTVIKGEKPEVAVETIPDEQVAVASDIASEAVKSAPYGEAIEKYLSRGKEANQLAYNDGFIAGYAEGNKASQRRAFEDGKEAVINKLRALLS